MSAPPSEEYEDVRRLSSACASVCLATSIRSPIGGKLVIDVPDLVKDGRC